jgi:hypothetical protein
MHPAPQPTEPAESRAPAPVVTVPNPANPAETIESTLDTGPVGTDTPCPTCGNVTVLETASASAVPENGPKNPETGEPLAGGELIHVCSVCRHLLEVFEGDVDQVLDELDARAADQAARDTTEEVTDGTQT